MFAVVLFSALLFWPETSRNGLWRSTPWNGKFISPTSYQLFFWGRHVRCRGCARVCIYIYISIYICIHILLYSWASITSSESPSQRKQASWLVRHEESWKIMRVPPQNISTKWARGTGVELLLNVSRFRGSLREDAFRFFERRCFWLISGREFWDVWLKLCWMIWAPKRIPVSKLHPGSEFWREAPWIDWALRGSWTTWLNNTSKPDRAICEWSLSNTWRPGKSWLEWQGKENEIWAMKHSWLFSVFFGEHSIP